MNVNYDILFEQVKNGIDISSNPPKLLLHACCAPCSTYCLTRVLPYFDVTLYYSNDNITNNTEWQKRLDELKKLADIVNSGKFETQPLRPLKLVICALDAQKFYRDVKGLEKEPEGGARCSKCFYMRLSNTLVYAQNNGFDLFGTTLSVSPYKNSQLLNAIGLNLQTDVVKWLPADFKKHGGYNESVRLSQQYNLYRQHYCGCEFSLQQMQEQSKSDLK
ncbi:MAG: epoxyqueuosine reductase QueH [Clostridia bacterium]|nr:epoxyqueuosine reductase QueH [Clostridia bacterium]